MKQILAGAAAFVMAFVLTGTAVKAGDADFTLVNKTGYEIKAVYVAGHDSDSWGNDILGEDTLGDGESVKITFGHSSKCKFDIKVTYSVDNSSPKWENVDLCQYDKITLTWDGKQTRARGE